MKNLLITLCIFTYSCGLMLDLDESIPVEIQPFFEEFKKEASERGIELEYKEYSIEFVRNIENTPDFPNSTEHLAAYTEYFDKKRKRFKIYISLDMYEERILHGDELDYYIFEKVCFHEFGHGFLNRSHSDNPNSIMKQGVIPYNAETKEDYLNELFNNKGK